VQHGYDNVNLNDLIADAGVSKGAFYHWFPPKDALIAALAERSAHEEFAVAPPARQRATTSMTTNDRSRLIHQMKTA
jgi:AcrR family transcriptional regulator